MSLLNDENIAPRNRRANDATPSAALAREDAPMKKTPRCDGTLLKFEIRDDDARARESTAARATRARGEDAGNVEVNANARLTVGDAATGTQARSSEGGEVSARHHGVLRRRRRREAGAAVHSRTRVGERRVRGGVRGAGGGDREVVRV